METVPGGAPVTGAESLCAAVGRVLGEPVPALRDTARIGEWLGARGLGLVPIRDPAAFAWPGHWIAVTASERALVMFGSPSGPLEGALAEDDPIGTGFVIAPLDIDLEPRTTRSSGRVEEIVLAPRTAAAGHTVTSARAIAGAGLDGDRYASGGGTFAGGADRTGQALTLIEAEVLALTGLTAAEARRNVVTRGIDLDVLIGRRFRIGAVECYGQRRAEPCAHLERLTRPGVLRALVHRGGLRVDIATGGRIAVGDCVHPIGDPGEALASADHR